MFDIGFTELLMIGLVALIVIGPERLPGIARTAGRWVGRGQRMLSQVKADIDQEIRAEELQKILDKQQNSSSPIDEIIEETSAALRDAEGADRQRRNDAADSNSSPATPESNPKDHV